MAADKRIYLVTITAGQSKVIDERRLIRATNAAQATHYALRGKAITTVASQEDLVAHLSDGLKVEDSSRPNGPTEPVDDRQLSLAGDQS